MPLHVVASETVDICAGVGDVEGCASSVTGASDTVVMPAFGSSARLHPEAKISGRRRTIATDFLTKIPPVMGASLLTVAFF